MNPIAEQLWNWLHVSLLIVGAVTVLGCFIWLCWLAVAGYRQKMGAIGKWFTDSVARAEKEQEYSEIDELTGRRR